MHWTRLTGERMNIKGKGNTHEATCTVSIVSGVIRQCLLLYEITIENILKTCMFSKKHQLTVFT